MDDSQGSMRPSDKDRLSIEDSQKTTKRVDSKEKMAEVRSLLEYLYLDVKVRSPEEVSSKDDYDFAYRSSN